MNIVDLYLRANEKYTKLNRDESIIRYCFDTIEQAFANYDGKKTKLRVAFNIPSDFNPMEISKKIMKQLRDQLIPVDFVIASKNYFELDFTFSQITPEVLHITPFLPIQKIIDFCEGVCIVRAPEKHVVENIPNIICRLSLSNGENPLVKRGDYIIKEKFKGITVTSNYPTEIMHEARNYPNRWNI